VKPSADRKLYLDEAAVLVLATSGERRLAAVARLEEFVRSGGWICTSAAALQGVQNYFWEHRRAPATLRQFWNTLDGLFREILPLRGADLGRALDLLEIERGPDVAPLLPDQALHAAIALNNEVACIADPRQCYEAIPGIKAFEF
jgi:hypothetical protein